MCAHLLVVLGECGRPVRPLGGLFLRLGVLPGQLSHLLFQALDLPGQPPLILGVLLGELAEFSAPRLRLKAAGMTERFPFGPSTRPPPFPS